MYDAELPTDFEPAGPERPSDDWTGEHVRMLRELAELGMALARAVAGQVLAQAEGVQPPEQPVVAMRGDPGLAFARVARTVRLTLALEARTREGVIARQAPAAFDYAGAAERVRAKLRAILAPGPRALEARRVVEQAFEAEHPDADDLDEQISEAFDRLQHDGLNPDARPIGDTIARLCRDLGVTPDWSRWANEPWAVDEARFQAEGSPYATTSSPPPLAGESLPRARPGVARRASVVTEGARRPTEGPLSQPPDSG